MIKGGLQTQNTIVKNTLQHRAEKRMTTITEKVSVPGLATLHTKGTEEVAKVLANVLKSRAGVTQIQWSVGQAYIEVTSESDMALEPTK